MKVRISLKVPAGPLAAATVRRGIEGLSGYLEPRAYDDIKLLLSELVTNSFRHAGVPEGSPIVVRVAAAVDAIEVSVTDQGPGFDLGPHEGPPDRDHGWGLRLVERIADDWGLRRDDGTTVWFRIQTTGTGGRREAREPAQS